jgi:hypothetical protein
MMSSGQSSTVAPNSCKFWRRKFTRSWFLYVAVSFMIGLVRNAFAQEPRSGFNN